MSSQYASNAGELIEFTQEIHLIVNIVKHAYAMPLPVIYMWICQLITLSNQCQTGVMVNSMIFLRKLWFHGNLL